MPELGHKAIRASAGSGKTFQLAHRYILLMAHGVSPDRIIALTFTRKAAGEIFDAITRYLSRAADDPGAARSMAVRIGAPELCTDDFKLMLKQLLRNLHRIHIGTLDSFTVGIAKAFPMELGMPADFEMVNADGGDGHDLRERTFRRIMSNEHSTGDERDAFHETLKLATFGEEKKQIGDVIDGLINSYRNYYIEAPFRELWGNPDRIWPEGFPWNHGVEDPSFLMTEVRSINAQELQHAPLMRSMAEFMDFAGRFSKTSEWNSGLESKAVFKRLMEHFSKHGEAPEEIRYSGKNYNLSPAMTSALTKLLRHLMSVEIDRALKRTSGMFGIFERFENAYRLVSRDSACFTFDDIQYLLAGSQNARKGSLITRDSSLEDRLYIDYRIDSRLDHWLLDEFQDTSNLQWEVIENLADEIIQDVSGERSFFFVGDVKQSIYSWRGGNPKLFDKVRKQYGETIELEPLDITYRCRRPVVDFINRVFSDLPSPELPAETIEQWEGAWNEHRVADEIRDDPGYVAVLEPFAPKDKKKPLDEDRHRIVAGIVRELNPGKRGLTVAVLVRTNKKGREIVDYLRSSCPGIPILHEGNAVIEDNPVVAALMALVECAAHPGNLMALRHVQMSPLGRMLDSAEFSHEDLSPRLMHQLYNMGFQAFIRHWGNLLNDAEPLDEFGLARLAALVDAAGQFDETHDCDPDKFLTFIKHYSTNEPSSHNSVRVMTIHQAKGLDFDAVILPDLEGGKSPATSRLIVSRGDDNNPEWLLVSPRPVIAKADRKLADEIRKSDIADTYEDLCTLYVAATRARYALYTVSGYPGDASTLFTHASLIKKQVTGTTKPRGSDTTILLEDESVIGLYEDGDRGWFAKMAGKPSKHARQMPDQVPADYRNIKSMRSELKRLSPSRQSDHEASAELLFLKSSVLSRCKGTGVHQLFEKIYWMEEADVPDLVAEWKAASKYPDYLKQQIADHFQQSLAHDDVRKALARPGDNAEVWREKPFEIVLKDQWITGTFDRVVIRRDGTGTITRVEIIDFKTNDIRNEDHLRETAERYTPQLELYGKVLESILGVKAGSIRLRLLFTSYGRVVTVRDEGC